MKKITVIFIIVLTAITAFADNNPVLVFRKDGSVDILSTDSLKRIECSMADADGNLTDKVTDQIFVLPDKHISIPVADIDSVVFGFRSSVIPKTGARRISEEEIGYISSFDGKILRYRSTAPAGIIPPKGSKIYYDAFAEVLPYGLCAEVSSVSVDAAGYAVEIKDLAPSEVFDEYFVSGNFELSMPAPQASDKRRTNLSDIKDGLPFNINTDVVDVSAKGIVKLRFENLVASVLTGYYSADIFLEGGIEVEADLYYPKPIKKEFESAPIRLFQGTIGGVLYPSLNMYLFADIEASCSLGLNLERSIGLHYRWVNNKGDIKIEQIRDEETGSAMEHTDKATTDLLLSGNIHLGVEPEICINTLFNAAGAGITAKTGPELSAEFGLETLNDLSEEYNPILYSKAFIDLCLLTKLETYAYTFNRESKIPLPFEGEIRAFNHRWDLLPKLVSMAARMCSTPEAGVPYSREQVIQVATSTDTPIAHDLPIGFEVVNEANGEVAAEIFTGETIAAEVDTIQGFVGEVPFINQDAIGFVARPVVKYSDKIVKCAPTDIMEGGKIQQVFATLCSSRAYFVGGAPIIGQLTSGNTTFIVGNQMPIAIPNPAFKNKRTAKVLSFIESQGSIAGGSSASIFGDWNGIYGDMEIQLSLRTDGTATYNGEQAKMQLNIPQSGVVLLTFDDGRTLLIEIIGVNAESLQISFRTTNDIITLTR
ncbi:MAG: hypothetical protein HDS65_08710 [Bacteroidales bacterium]|nr:hypothetical protein [Bacteroidales bacterium]